ncbi:unnamed protein product [Ambrosiozyma monospora]|uniref:Unnamed protein product n=1 Tax=Ambrosiozyma monospora TaxID=43982 RepID=A0A9W6T9G3_AMBMO|nr:unnamed protein product [Ambrosiozyma monospora]
MLTLEIGNNLQLIRCWFYCFASNLPEYHFTIRNQDQAQAQALGQGQNTSTPSTAPYNIPLTNALKNIRMSLQDNIPILREGEDISVISGSFRRALMRKVNTATNNKILEFGWSFEQIYYREFTNDSREGAFQGMMDRTGFVATLLINFLQSPDDTMEYEEKLEYFQGNNGNMSFAGISCSIDGFIYSPSKSGPSNTPKKYVVKAWKLKLPNIRTDVVAFPDVPESKMFIYQIIMYCLAGCLTNTDLLDFENYFIYNFDLESVLNAAGANGRTLLYKREETQNMSLLCAMASSAYFNVVHLEEIKSIEYKSAVDAILGINNDPALGNLNAPTIKDSGVYFSTCREIQQSQGQHPNMVLSVNYVTSKLFFGSTLDHEFKLNDEDEVIVKILDLYNIDQWVKLRYDDDGFKEDIIKQLKFQVANEISIYSHIWRYFFF